MKREIRTAMSIAGSDSSGGAGIQADLKSFNLLGVHGLTVVTCVTAQNTKSVEGIYKIPADKVGNQIDTIFKEVTPKSVKIGMLYDGKVAEIVSDKISRYNIKPVVDPVLTAGSGDELSKTNLLKMLKKKIIPKSYVLTPNIYEAELLTREKISSLEDMKECCKYLWEQGSSNILIKGGHLSGRYSKDVFFDGHKARVFSLPTIEKRDAHGSGCTLSALISGYLTLGYNVKEAVKKAKYTLWCMIKKSYKLGDGRNVINNLYLEKIPEYLPTKEHFDVWNSLNENINEFLDILPNESVPEVGTNIGFALSDAESKKDICALDGRIVKTSGNILKCGQLVFGGSKHISSVILSAMQFDERFRCTTNIKFSKKRIEICRKADLKTGSFNRREEPKEIDSTMEWGTKRVIEKLGFVPDVIFDTGDIGKEPMIRILGKTPEEIVEKIKRIKKID